MYNEDSLLFENTFNELYLLKFTKYKMMAIYNNLFLRKNGSNIIIKKNKPMNIIDINFFGDQSVLDHLHKDKFWDDIKFNKNTLFHSCYLILKTALIHLFNIMSSDKKIIKQKYMDEFKEVLMQKIFHVKYKKGNENKNFVPPQL